ncbi:cupin domain-containing protein [Shewanella surugensis]|uniref:AraC family ligand binding domain-containing protein n=1 Tax=Shewanella surugensis TaxID=212020 RepID=A0ABT0LAI9_9GAMM|nr:AraC family ligand binding domain-containing protein [Shewanella surugensis]MCL1124377.1 AraC family ligand binding domain-containing protein [Shewanella surugensis]
MAFPTAVNSQITDSISLKDVGVISREKIRAIASVEVDGKSHHLGEHRDFRRNELLNSFMPESGRYSFSWVRLRDGEILDNHDHPTSSMILVCQGSVYATGNVERLLIEGDIVCVPPGKKHGFRTEQGQDFHGLSIQFEGEGLYENELEARVNFLAHQNEAYEALERLNQRLMAQHKKNIMFQLVASGELEHNDEKRKNFLEAVYVWSKYFQRILYTRQAYCQDRELMSLYEEHLREELGHDEMLRSQYDLQGNVYDPILEASSQWFINKMINGDEAEKIVVVHLVAESSGFLFGQATQAIFKKPVQEDSYFEVHAEFDEGHRDIGKPYLQRLSPAHFPKLMETCRQAWDQMTLINERFAAISIESSTKKSTIKQH